MAWCGVEVPAGVPGPWVDLVVSAPGLAFIESEQSLSVVYHELKWALPPDTALVVAPVAATPKLKGLAPGTSSWLRERTALASGS